MPDFDFELRARIPRILVEVVPGEPLSVTVPIVDAGEDPVPIVDGGAWSGLLHVRQQWASPEVLHLFTTAGVAPNITVTEGSAGALVLTATAIETAAWQAAWSTTPPTAGGDLFVTDDTGTPHCLCDLVFSLLPRTTRED